MSTEETPQQGKLGPAGGRYATLAQDRGFYLTMARKCARHTITQLIRQNDGATKPEPIRPPWQSLGAQGVNNLASKLLLTQLPPNTPFFKLQIDSLALSAIPEDDSGKNFKTQLEMEISTIENGIVEDIEASADRVAVFEAMKHLIVCGNVALFDSPDGLRVFHLDRYVVVRDPMGNVIEAVIKESVAPAALDAAFLELLKENAAFKQDHTKSPDRSIDIYTHLKRNADVWTIHQECYNLELPESQGTYGLNTVPWMFLRMIRVDGEEYGRSLVEEYLGDLMSLEVLTEAVVEGAAAAARVIGLVAPNATTSMKALNDAPNCEFVQGHKDDVTFLQIEKYADFQVAYNAIGMLSERLSRAFLLNTSVQRQAERVTAEEIRFMARELEDALGGVYAILAQEFQLRYINSRMARLQAAGKVPQFSKKIVKPTIVTGLQALGRGHDRNKLTRYLATLKDTVGEQKVDTYVRFEEAAGRLAVADGIETKGLIRTEEEVREQQKRTSMESMISQFGPEVIKQMGGMAQQGMTPPQSQPA